MQRYFCFVKLLRVSYMCMVYMVKIFLMFIGVAEDSQQTSTTYDHIKDKITMSCGKTKKNKNISTIRYKQN